MACARTGFFVTRATGRMSRLRRASCGRGESKSCEKERGAEVGLRAHLTAPVMDTCRQATNWRPAAFLLLVANHPDEHAVEGDVLELRHGANLGQHPAVLDPARPREDALQWAMDALVDVIFLGSATGNSSQLATAPGHTRGQVPPPLGLAQCELFQVVSLLYTGTAVRGTQGWGCGRVGVVRVASDVPNHQDLPWY